MFLFISTQKYFYRFSKSRGKADYFEGRDDSGVVSARFINVPGGTDEYRQFYFPDDATVLPQINDEERLAYIRLYENCIAMGAPVRPNTETGTQWTEWYGSEVHPYTKTRDRCRMLFVINTVGMGRGTTMIWETNPPLLYGELPPPWTSEQETAITHLQRNLEEINAMCQTGYIAAKIQIMVCEPISSIWTEWIDGQVPACGGKTFDPINPPTNGKEGEYSVEDRPSPIQIVVAGNAETADTCHDLKSGFMEQRIQDLAIAPPYLSSSSDKNSDADPTIKTTNPDLFSSDHHDLYVAMKWSTLVTIRSVHAFLQASADIAAGASVTGTGAEDEKDMMVTGPSSPFLIPSFVRVSYVSEENSKVAKWRMHGDFFHPAAWEICKDSFDMTYIPYSLSGSGGVSSICTRNTESSLAASTAAIDQKDCGQWWIYFTELQMPTSPEVFANEVTPPVVQGGSNFFWMITDRQRQEIVKGYACQHDSATDTTSQQRDVKECPDLPQAIIPLGDMESFLINFTPNTALGRHHIDDSRRPGYSNEEERKADRQRVKERKQLNDQEDIEKALFDYTIYPAALFHKDATLKAARERDVALTRLNDSIKQDGTADNVVVGPHAIKSSYYDVTITKPRPPVLGWCQMIARRGLCTLYADYFRTGSDNRCHEACGFKKDWTRI